MKYFVYIIQTVDDTLYCGIAKNIFERYKKHLEGKGAKYLKSHKPQKIVYTDIFEDRSSALKEEFRIKSLTRQEKNNLIEKNKKRTEKFFISLDI